MIRVYLAFCVLLVLMHGIDPVYAQRPDTTTSSASALTIPLVEGEGTAMLTAWPASLRQLLDRMGRRAPRLLPKIDSLALDYRYVADSAGTQWTFVLSWKPGDRVLYRGDVMPWREAPPDVRMVSVELLADVLVNGQKKAEMIVAVDSMALDPLPSVYTFEVRDVSYEHVFLDTAPEAARRYLQQDVTLANLQVERMGFASFGTTGDVRPEPERQEDGRERRAPPPEPSIYTPRVGILIGWRIGPEPYYVGQRGVKRPRATERPRSDGVGRTPVRADPPRDTDRETSDRETSDRETSDRETSDRETSDRETSDRETSDRGEVDRGEAGRGDAPRAGREGETGDTGRRAGDEDEKEGKDKKRRKRDEDEDEDEDTLVPAAVGALAAVALAGGVGGSVGYYGTADTPLGLMAGYIRPRGGVLLQASVNSAVLDDDGTQRLTAKALGFYDVFEARVQPAAGFGVQAAAEGEHTAVDPSLSVGLVGNFGHVVLFGGFDVVQQVPEFGVAVNFRYRPPPTEPAAADRTGRRRPIGATDRVIE